MWVMHKIASDRLEGFAVSPQRNPVALGARPPTAAVLQKGCWNGLVQNGIRRAACPARLLGSNRSAVSPAGFIHCTMYKEGDETGHIDAQGSMAVSHAG